jgi:site-specific DNA recombinase
MVYGRRRNVKGRDRYLPPDQWLWSPEPVHPASVTREQWEAAQAQGQHHATSRDGYEPNTHPQTRRSYRLRGRVRCRACQHRMSGVTRIASRYYMPGAPDLEYTYYACPPSRHRDPDHPRTVSIREDDLIDIARTFLSDHVLGPDRARLLAEQIPATAAEDTRRRQAETARLQQRLRQIDAAEDAHAREIEALTHADAPPAAITALRSRLIARFTELEEERAAIGAQLTTLAADHGQDQSPELLDQLPVITRRLGDDTPLSYEHGLFDAFGIQFLYRPHLRQVTIFATITDTTPQAIAALAAISENPCGDTPLDPRDQQAFSEFTQRPIDRQE